MARKAPDIIGPHLLALGRWGLAALVLVVLARSELWAQRASIAWAGYALLQKKWSSPLTATARLAAICLGANRAAVALYLGPLYAAVTTWIALGEAPGWHHLVGSLLILPGVFLVSRTSKT